MWFGVNFSGIAENNHLGSLASDTEWEKDFGGVLVSGFVLTQLSPGCGHWGSDSVHGKSLTPSLFPPPQLHLSRVPNRNWNQELQPGISPQSLQFETLSSLIAILFPFLFLLIFFKDSFI